MANLASLSLGIRPWYRGSLKTFFGMWDFSYSKTRTQDFKAKRGQDSGGGERGGGGRRAYIWMSFVVYR